VCHWNAQRFSISLCIGYIKCCSISLPASEQSGNKCELVSKQKKMRCSQRLTECISQLILGTKKSNLKLIRVGSFTDEMIVNLYMLSSSMKHHIKCHKGSTNMLSHHNIGGEETGTWSSCNKLDLDKFGTNNCKTAILVLVLDLATVVYFLELQNIRLEP
jgi:hypothetical protein